MDMIKASILTMVVILALPFIVVFSIIMFALHCAHTVVDWLTDFS